MRAWVIGFFFVVSMGRAGAGEDIEAVLERSHAERLARFETASEFDPRVAVVRASFARLIAAVAPAAEIELRVVTGPVMAETLNGQVIVANAALAQWPEGQRLFVLAHELGHVRHQHWSRMGLLFRQYIPGAVAPESTDPVAAVLSREASALAYEQELDADAYAFKVLQRMGIGFDAALGAFMNHGVQPDTATHPGTRKRVAHLRLAQQEEASRARGQ